MIIEKEIKNIKNQLTTLISIMSKNKQYADYDIEAGRVNTSKAQRTADDANTLAQENEGCVLEVADIASENDGCAVELAGMASENNDAILELAEYIDKLEKRITILESEANV